MFERKKSSLEIFTESLCRQFPQVSHRGPSGYEQVGHLSSGGVEPTPEIDSLGSLGGGLDPAVLSKV